MSIHEFSNLCSDEENTPQTGTSDGLANCYMVAPGGSTVTIPITRAITIGGMNALTKAVVEILWDDNKVINKPKLSKRGDSRIITVKTPSKQGKARQGNAVIAIKDAGTGTIYWSWHIWVVNYDPNTGGTWTNNGYTFMDRNLGATDNQLNPASWGLLYQWGRKDPFPGGKEGTAGYAALSHFKGMRDAGSPDPAHVSNRKQDADGITDGILESIQNPTTFFSAIIEGNWLPAPDNTLWNTPEGRKSVYDPCPAGWRVPYGGSTTPDNPWYNLKVRGWTAGDDGGINWGDCALFPANGWRYYANGLPSTGGEEITLWMGDSEHRANYMWVLCTDTRIMIWDATKHGAFGRGIRCVKE
jgi:hypothetical protein